MLPHATCRTFYCNVMTVFNIECSHMRYALVLRPNKVALGKAPLSSTISYYLMTCMNKL